MSNRTAQRLILVGDREERGADDIRLDPSEWSGPIARGTETILNIEQDHHFSRLYNVCDNRVYVVSSNQLRVMRGAIIMEEVVIIALVELHFYICVNESIKEIIIFQASCGFVKNDSSIHR